MFNDVLIMLGASFICVIGTWTIFWLISSTAKQTRFLEFAWPIGFAIASISYASLTDGNFLKKAVMVALVLTWTGRSVWHLIKRFNPEKEDMRFFEIEKKLGAESLQLKYLALCLFQGFIAVILTLPFMIVCIDYTPQWHLVQFLAIGIWVLGLIGEFYADVQLDTFRANPVNTDGICKTGLWRYTRHPNYFFEWVVWIAFFLFALPAEGGSAAIIAPLIVYILFHRVSIPMNEALIIQSKGDAYCIYQQETCTFFPWFYQVDKK